MEIDIYKLTHGTVLHCNSLKNSDGTCRRWRISGNIKTWKTRPGEFKIPIKRGMYEHDYLTHNNADGFHMPDDCASFLASSALLGKVHTKFKFWQPGPRDVSKITILPLS